MPSSSRTLIALVAATCIGAAPRAEPAASDLVLTLSTSQAIVATDQTPAVRLTLTNVSARTLYLDPLDISLFLGFHLIDLASGAESDVIGEQTLVDLPPHVGEPLPPGGSITLATHLLPIHQAGTYRVTASATLALASGAPSIRLRPTNTVFLSVRIPVPDSEIDAHIDAGIPAERRAYVRKVMLSLPPAMRDAVIGGYDANGAFYSNRLSNYADIARLKSIAMSKIPTAVDPAIVGEWTCTDTLDPRGAFTLLYRADGTGRAAGRDAWFGTDGTYVYSREVTSAAGRDRYSIAGNTLHRTTAGYWHEGHWTPLPSGEELLCKRAGKR